MQSNVAVYWVLAIVTACVVAATITTVPDVSAYASGVIPEWTEPIVDTASLARLVKALIARAWEFLSSFLRENGPA